MAAVQMAGFDGAHFASGFARPRIPSMGESSSSDPDFDLLAKTASLPLGAGAFFAASACEAGLPSFSVPSTAKVNPNYGAKFVGAAAAAAAASPSLPGPGMLDVEISGFLNPGGEADASFANPYGATTYGLVHHVPNVALVPASREVVHSKDVRLNSALHLEEARALWSRSRVASKGLVMPNHPLVPIQSPMSAAVSSVEPDGASSAAQAAAAKAAAAKTARNKISSSRRQKRLEIWRKKRIQTRLQSDRDAEKVVRYAVRKQLAVGAIRIKGRFIKSAPAKDPLRAKKKRKTSLDDDDYSHPLAELGVPGASRGIQAKSFTGPSYARPSPGQQDKAKAAMPTSLSLRPAAVLLGKPSEKLAAADPPLFGHRTEPQSPTEPQHTSSELFRKHNSAAKLGGGANSRAGLDALVEMDLAA